MTTTENRLRELLRAAAPQLDGVSPDLLETHRHRSRQPLAVAGAITLIAALAFVLTMFTGTTSKNTKKTPPAHSSSPPAASTGRVQGILLIVPPIQRPYPTSGTIVISGPRHLTRHVGREGRFSVTLPPGHYTIIGHTPKYMANARPGDCITLAGPTVVLAHRTVHVNVICGEK
jgi:hypothetical protein